MFEVRFSEEVLNFYQSAEDAVVKRLNRCIEHLRQNPFFGRNIRKLRGELEGSYRYRLGSLRVVYSIDKKEKVVWIEYIKIRGKALRPMNL